MSRDKIIFLGGSGSGASTSAANTWTALQTFNLIPNIPATDMATVTSAGVSTIVKNTKYYDTITTARTYTIPSMNSGDGFSVMLIVSTAATLTFSTNVKRAGSANTDITTLALNTGIHMLNFRQENATTVLMDSTSQSRLIHSTTFDPKAVCDGTFDGLFLRTVGDDAPNGLVITAWKLSFEADPTTEIDLDLMRADAFIGQANSAVMDVLDTTAGVSSESTAANINSGAAVANGKVIYLAFGTAYTEANHQCIFELWGYPVN
jgi:hypothetical protein